jgi:glycosyltransferase involved in cell wall biosynthesis
MFDYTKCKLNNLCNFKFVNKNNLYKIMNITYITEYEATNIHKFSGLGYYIGKSLENQGCKINYITLPKKNKRITFIIKFLFYKLARKSYDVNREPFICKHYATVLNKLLTSKTDIIFSPGTLPVALLKTDIPVVIYTDACFAGMINFYKYFTNMPKETIRNGNYLEQSALSNCTLAIFSSDWAAESAKQHYDILKSKVFVVPFGANIESSVNEEAIVEIIRKKSTQVVKLLFLGVDWERKGGDVALEAAEILNARGIRTELHLVGSQMTDSKFPSFVVNHGFITKSTKEGRDLLNDLLITSHFLILPTKADCTPVVYSEANSFGLPCLTTNVGGIPSIIKSRVNGETFSVDESPLVYADYISEMIKDRQAYNDLCMSSYKEYLNRLNWSTSGKKLVRLMRNAIVV